MCSLDGLFANNRAWARARVEADPEFFTRLAGQQAPRYLWIGCSDSRVPANEILGLDPGEVFVHRNIANLVVHSDLNCLSVLQYAVETLKVEHIMVVGHYGCGGVQAVAEHRSVGLSDNWLRHIEDIAIKHETRLPGHGDEDRAARLVELNVVEQVANVCRTTIVQDAWRRSQPLAVHGWIYRLQGGLIRDLCLAVTRDSALAAQYAEALAALSAQYAEALAALSA